MHAFMLHSKLHQLTYLKKNLWLREADPIRWTVRVRGWSQRAGLLLLLELQLLAAFFTPTRTTLMAKCETCCRTTLLASSALLSHCSPSFLHFFCIFLLVFSQKVFLPCSSSDNCQTFL